MSIHAESPTRRGRGPVCLLVPLHAEPTLYGVLLRELSRDMPDILFTLADVDAVNVIWLCGFERGGSDHISSWRRSHPHATVIVTGRGPVELWREEVLSAGADQACSWPANYEELSRFLHQRHAEQRGPVTTLRRVLS